MSGPQHFGLREIFADVSNKIRKVDKTLAPPSASRAVSFINSGEGHRMLSNLPSQKIKNLNIYKVMELFAAVKLWLLNYFR